MDIREKTVRKAGEKSCDLTISVLIITILLNFNYTIYTMCNCNDGEK